MNPMLWETQKITRQWKVGPGKNHLWTNIPLQMYFNKIHIIHIFAFFFHFQEWSLFQIVFSSGFLDDFLRK